ncbi:endonuclease domain-containing protein [Nodularia spumigena]|jgi:very-short-patch-repair endonuclease|uniref:endonuclease domain-containing protein n=1 Tax=Nodularia spumigena TaxID=70799 RepID=UPI00232C9C0E|nr:endonuclease domain-containing protein [Nodularia spumigena]MDB9316501.1 endonuclease domain-containing protein [Nodularia spumigena CS-590/01A]MDB9328474.1 endonuclease domain-containing protein [Nodularia spumigena CS-590/02]MDB9335176.1 endonuclease domain-containing protein [Nodularia spumigena CS-590/01]MDB9349176.1 endonuclease domain-containing protein [Nodularia spumigena CS-588/01]MDB9352205.1 endonuclease domain-containing protein [Nodularia spumigena CS-588/05]
MNKLYNKNTELEKRRLLRQNITKAEKLIWDNIRDRQLENCKFRRQYSVDRFVIDFYSAELKLAIEIDGDSHFQNGAAEYDQARQEFMESVGIKFIRFTNNDVYGNLSGVLESIVQYIRDLRTSPPPPLLHKERGV